MFLTEIIIIGFLLLLNAFFALSEMAIVSASRPILKQKAASGSRRAAIAVSLAEDSGKFLSTVQIGITLVGTLAGAYGGATIAEGLAPGFNEIAFIAPHGEGVAVALVVGLLTYFSVVIGELIPKKIALSNPEQLAMFVARPMQLLSIIFAPIVKLLDFSAAIIGRLFGLKANPENHITEEEVKAVIAEGAQTGALEQQEHAMLQRIIRLADRDVKSIMTHRVDVTYIDLDDNTETIRAKIHSCGHSRYPVIKNGDNNRILGIVQAKDILEVALAGEKISVADFIREAPLVPATSSCLKLLELIKNDFVQMAIVIDEYGSAEGIVTISDLMEAIIGVIPSNYDEGSHAQIILRQDGSWLVDGKTSIDELVLTQGLENIAIDNLYDTLAGLLLYCLNRTPREGEIVEKFGYSFEVMDMDGKRVDKVLITKITYHGEGI